VLRLVRPDADALTGGAGGSAGLSGPATLAHCVPLRNHLSRMRTRDDIPASDLDRRTLLRGAGALAIAGSAGLTGCSLVSRGSSAAGGDARTIKIGYVTPSTGPLASFGEADTFVVDSLRAYFGTNGIKTGAGTSDVEIVIKDCASDSKQAATVATSLINDDAVDLMLVSSTPDVTNPVADACEASGVPCISTVAPWQPYFFGRGASPVSSFTWTYHFFWGLEDVEAVFMDMWDAVDSNGAVGALWPNDPDGNAWGDPATGFLPAVNDRGYDVVDPGFYANGSPDFTPQITQFRDNDAQILVGVPIPPDFTTFWQQAVAAKYQPKLVTVAKALLFPSAIDALAGTGNNLGTEVWWSPSHPFTSSLTQQSAKDLADAYTAETGKQWTQPLGYVHALFEVATAALSACDSPEDRRGVVAALSQLQLQTVCGPLDWNAGPVPNVAKTPLVGGQWRLTGDKSELVIVSNAQALNIPRTGNIQPMR
jgi:branched-chain amino acid transport system substrate-binding protein